MYSRHAGRPLGSTGSAGVERVRILTTLTLALFAACSPDQPATITYAWTPDYPPKLLAIRLGDQRIAGETLTILPNAATTVEILTSVPAGAAIPLEINLVSGADTLAALTAQLNLRAGQRLTLQIAAGPPHPGFNSSCAVRIGPVPLRGGAPADSLVARWYQTDPTDIAGPC